MAYEVSEGAMARQMTEGELLEYFEINFNLAMDARRNFSFEESAVYESFNFLIEQALYRLQSVKNNDIDEVELFPV